MCGIVGYIGSKNATEFLVEGLHRLEYRGYDSAGLAIHRPKGIDVIKRCGKVKVLEQALTKSFKGKVGIGHTRWATHGEPSDTNAHPHTDAGQQIALVHNGIIENATQLRQEMQSNGIEFVSDTDTEVLANLIATSPADSLQESVRIALNKVTGAYGIAVLSAQYPNEIVVARNGSPVVLGLGNKEMYIASDASALVRHTQQVIYLDDGEIASVRADGYQAITLDASVAAKTTDIIEVAEGQADKGDFQHFTLKEIKEQPHTLARTLRGRIDDRFSTARLGGLNLDPRQLMEFRRIKLIGCGSAYISAFLGARMIERITRTPCDAEPAAEFRYRNPIIEKDTLYLAVSQSGETFDTLAAVQEIKRKGGVVLGIVNVVGSSIARACSGGIYLHAGPEVAVVSTKTFSSTLLVFALLALHLGRMKDLSPSEGAKIIDALQQLPNLIESLLDDEDNYMEIAKKYAQYDNAYFVGRNEGFAIAMEGALKLKEVSYIHAEAYPASELKHGPLALVSPSTPTFAIVPDDDLLAKNLSTIAEIKARKGPVLAITQPMDQTIEADDVITIPKCHPLIDPIAMLIPLQLIAYHAALERGCNVDQPRNLAKSVTVE